MFDINNVDAYVSNAAARKHFGRFELLQCRIVNNCPALVLKQRSNDNETLIYVCTSRSDARWATIGQSMSDCKPLDNDELVNKLEDILAWCEFCGLPRVGNAVSGPEAFNVSDALVRFCHFGGLSPLQSAKLVSLMVAKDGSAISRFWDEKAAELAQHVNAEKAIATG